MYVCHCINQSNVQPRFLCRKNLANAIRDFCKEAMKFTTKENNWDWPFVLPLYHFLSGDCEPFASLEYNPENIQFNVRANDLDYRGVRQKITKGYVDDNVNTFFN